MWRNIERAAELAGKPVAALARTDAEERAGRIPREHGATTIVPSEFFDELIVAFEDPACPNQILAEAAAHLHETIDRD